MDPLQQLMGGQPYQQGDFQRSGPQMQPTGVLESLMGAFSPRPWGVGDAVNAAMMAMPGARGGLVRSVIERGRAGRPNLTGSFASEQLPGLERSQYEMGRTAARDAAHLEQNLSRLSPEERAAYDAAQAKANDRANRLVRSMQEYVPEE